MPKASKQKFIGRNRAPRVQIEYDVEIYGSEKKIQLPFVMGVMSDLSGKSEEPLADVADRKRSARRPFNTAARRPRIHTIQRGGTHGSQTA